jgi:hypothetical protein
MLDERSKPVFEQPLTLSLRVASVATLVGLAITIILIALTIAFPTFGMPPTFDGFLYFPPQAYLAAALVPVTTALAFVTGVKGVIQNWRARRYGWATAFTALLALLMMGPVYLIYNFGVGLGLLAHIPWLPIAQILGWSFGILIWISFSALILTGACGLIAEMSARPTQ